MVMQKSGQALAQKRKGLGLGNGVVPWSWPAGRRPRPPGARLLARLRASPPPSSDKCNTTIQPTVSHFACLAATYYHPGRPVQGGLYWSKGVTILDPSMEHLPSSPTGIADSPGRSNQPSESANPVQAPNPSELDQPIGLDEDEAIADM